MATNQLCREATEVHDPIEELKRLVASRNKLPSTQEVKVCEEQHAGELWRLVEMYDDIAKIMLEKNDDLLPGSICCEIMIRIADYCFKIARKGEMDVSKPKEWTVPTYFNDLSDHLLNPETTGLALDLLKDHRMKDMVVASEEQKFLEIGFVYEEAAFVRICLTITQWVESQLNIQWVPTKAAPTGVCVEATAPARVDLAGGWTDTPPVSYELGGKVLGLSLKIDEARPNRCTVKRVKDAVIRIVQHTELDASDKAETLRTAEEFRRHSSSVHERCSLVASCLKAAKIIELDELTSETLHDYLMRRWKGGFEIEVCSDLPKGSGMGTSSILAGCIISAAWTAVGVEYSVDDVILAVYLAEQLLSTGGGWQDNVHGLLPGGVRLGKGHKDSQKIEHRTFHPLGGGDRLRALESHFVLLYTGQARLAKNILRDVVRQWYLDEKVAAKFRRNLFLADEVAKVFEDGERKNEDLDYAHMGSLLSEYWTLKKNLVADADPEPECCRILFEAMRPHCFGMSLAGAGGGGFMVLMTKLPNASNDIRRTLETVVKNNPDVPQLKDTKLFNCSLDYDGLKVTIDGKTIELKPLRNGIDPLIAMINKS